MCHEIEHVKIRILYSIPPNYIIARPHPAAQQPSSRTAVAAPALGRARRGGAGDPQKQSAGLGEVPISRISTH